MNFEPGDITSSNYAQQVSRSNDIQQQLLVVASIKPFLSQGIGYS